MRTRSMILFATIALFIQAICILIIWVNGLIFDRLLTEASLEMYKRETLKTHYYSSANYLSYYSKMLEANENSLKALNRLFVFVNPQVQNMDEIVVNEELNLNFGATYPIPASLVNTNWEKYNVYFGAQCYSNMTQLSNPLSQKDLISMKIQEIYSIFGTITYKGSIINQKQLYGFMESQEVFTEYPCVNYQSLLQGYKFQDGKRYNEAKTYFQETDIMQFDAKLSPPIASKIFMDTSITLVLPLFDELDQFNGFWASIFIPPKIQDFFQFNQESIKTFFLLNQQGVLLSHPYNITYDKLPLYIYNESITGFNEEDWQQILSDNPQSNCQQYYELNVKILCRRNSIYQRELYITISKFEKYHLYLLRINDDLEYSEFINEFQIYIQNSITLQIKVNAYYQLSLFVVISFILLIVTYYLFIPIDFIIQSCIFRMKNQGTLSFFKGELSTKNKSLMSVEMKSLYEASMNFFHKLSLLSCSKSFYCKFIENLKPRKQEIKEIQEFQQNLKYQKLKIIDTQEFSFEFQLKQILIALQQCQNLKDDDSTQQRYQNSNWEFQNEKFERSLEQSQKNFLNLNQ